LHPSDVAREVGDGGDERRPGFKRRVLVGTVVAVGVKAQRWKPERDRDPARAQVVFGKGAAYGAGGGKESLGRGPDVAGRWLRRARETAGRFVEKGAGFVERIAQTRMTPVESNEIEQVAMLGRGGIGLMLNCT
jgi:hypothetical protein